MIKSREKQEKISILKLNPKSNSKTPSPSVIAFYIQINTITTFFVDAKLPHIYQFRALRTVL